MDLEDKLWWSVALEDGLLDERTLRASLAMIEMRCDLYRDVAQRHARRGQQEKATQTFECLHALSAVASDFERALFRCGRKRRPIESARQDIDARAIITEAKQ